jgi:hypothetical protein
MNFVKTVVFVNKFESESPSELEIFLAYMEPLFQKTADETNNYATQQLNNTKRKKLKDDDKWFEITEDELKAYFALIILMSCWYKCSAHHV